MREIIVRDLTKCINCETCVSACQTRHGRARIAMSGPRFGPYQLPDVCRHCPDTPCVTACHLGGMQRSDEKTFVSDACRGCNKCVEACRYGVVKLLPRNHVERRGFIQNILAQAKLDNAAAPNYRVATDAARCVQCGICVQNCPAGIPVRDYARQGKTVEDARCFGCGLCVEKCPRGTLRFETYPVLPLSKYRADKCDLCRDYAESNCVKECPTGALMRVQVDQQLAQLNTSLYDFLVYPDGKKTEEEQANLEPEPMPMSIPILTPLPEPMPMSIPILTPLPAFMQSMTEGD